MKKSLLIVSMVLVVLALSACDRFQVASAQVVPTNAPVLANVQDDGGVIAEGNVVPNDSSHIYTRKGGHVSEVLVKEGDQVEKDAVIMRLSDQDLGGKQAKEAALAAAQLEEQAAQKALDDLKTNAGVATSAAQNALTQADKNLIDAQQALDDFDNDQYQTDLDNLIKDVSNAKEDLDDAQTEFDKYKDMDVDNADRKRADDALQDAQKKYDDAVRKQDMKINEMDQYTSQAASAQSQHDFAQQEYDKRKDGPDPADLSLAEQRLSTAQAQVTAAQEALDGVVEIHAPFAGTITNLDAVVGETLLPNQSVAEIADFTSWYIETNDLTEMEVVKISEGQNATIVPDSMEELELPATVEWVDMESGKKGGDVTYTVRLKLDDTDPNLRWGMTVEVRFAE